MDIISKNKDFLKNPDKVPLNKLYLEYKHVVAKEPVLSQEDLEQNENLGEVATWHKRYQIKTERKPALDKCWIQQHIRFVEFQPFYPQFDNNQNQQFMKQNKEFLRNLNQLLDCPYQQFWCYILFERRVSFILTHFLENAIPPYCTKYLDGDFLELYNKVYSCILRIYERLITCYVSQNEFMSESVVVEYLNNSKLLDVRSIYLLCFLYNHSCPEFIRKLIRFCDNNNRESFKADVREMLCDILQEFDKLEALDLLQTTTGTSLRPKPNKFDPAWLEDTSSYILEMAASLHEFLCVYEPALEIIFELQLPQRLTHIYQKIYTELYEMLENKGDVFYDWSRYEHLVKQWLALGRFHFINLFNQFTCHLCEKIVKSRTDRAEQENCLETYLELFSSALEDDLFIRDYNNTYSVETQFQMLADTDADFDKTQTEYLLESLHHTIKGTQNEYIEEKIDSIKDQEKVIFPEELYESIYDTLTQYAQVQPTSSNNNINSKMYPEPVITALKQYGKLLNRYETILHGSKQQNHEKPSEDNDELRKPSAVEIEYRIKLVLEMLPNLGAGFVLKCLEKMNYEPEQVIAKVLDDNLPMELLEIPRDSIRASSSNSAGSSTTSVQPPKVISYIGKKPEYADAKELLDYKTPDIKNLVLNASRAYDVDDDYDDRNDVYGVYENNDESKIYRHLKQAGVQEYNVAESDSSSSSESEEQNKQGGAPNKNMFCEDPAVIRARREAQRGRNYRGGPRDVTGRPKGQGQEQSVQQNRDKKNVNKSSRANHNRKGGAQWKRNRGMLPS